MDEKTKQLVDELIGQARTEFEASGTLMPPRAWLVDARGAFYVAAFMFHDEAGKDAAARQLRQLAREHQAVAMVYVAEAWNTKTMQAPGSALFYTPPVSSPQRIEAIMFSVEWPGYGAQGYGEVLREGRERPTFLYPDLHEGPIENFAGRFIGALPCNWAKVGTSAPLRGFRTWAGNQRRCRLCACIDVHACMVGGVPCHWVEKDLCSACRPLVTRA